MYICMEPILVHIINGGGEGHNPFYSIRLEADGMMLMDRGRINYVCGKGNFIVDL